MSRRIEDLAAAYWERVGRDEPFPRRLERVIPLFDPVSLVALTRLAPSGVSAWLRRRGAGVPIAAPERPLDGCLFVYRDQVAIFVDAGLDPNTRGLIVAHEFAHYLAEYRAPRERVARRLDPSLLLICDGDRAAGPDERLGATLAGVALAAHVHFMERPSGRRLPAATRAVEARADALALELIAPRRIVLGCAQAEGIAPGDRALLRALLEGRFGVPGRWAAPYARRLAAGAARRRGFSESWGI